MNKRLLLLAYLLFTLIGMAFGCSSATSIPPAIPAPLRACVAVHVHGESGFLDGATVTVEGRTATTTNGGYFYFYPVTPGPVTIHVEAKDYESADQPYTAPVAAPGACDIDVILHPTFRPLPELQVEGQHFTTATGPITLVEDTAFHLLGRYLNGEDITPVLKQRQAAGYNTLRVFTRYLLSQYGIGDSSLSMHPDLYIRIPAFLRLCARYGFYVEFVAYVGSDNDYDPQHWPKLGAAIKGETNRLAELVNENNVHAAKVPTDTFSPIPGVLCSHGSNGSQSIPVEPFWGYATFHSNGAFEEQRKGGHNAMEIWNGPTLTNETSGYIYGGGLWLCDTGANPHCREDRAHDMGAGAALLAGGIAFNSPHSKSAELWNAGEESAARALAAGAHSVPLSCQNGPYVHRQDLEGNTYLRVYQRGSDAQCIVSIRP